MDSVSCHDGQEGVEREGARAQGDHEDDAGVSWSPVVLLVHHLLPHHAHISSWSNTIIEGISFLLKHVGSLPLPSLPPSGGQDIHLH